MCIDFEHRSLSFYPSDMNPELQKHQWTTCLCGFEAFAIVGEKHNKGWMDIFLSWSKVFEQGVQLHPFWPQSLLLN